MGNRWLGVHKDGEGNWKLERCFELIHDNSNPHIAPVMGGSLDKTSMEYARLEKGKLISAPQD